jgi:hypothetical protein
MEHAGDFVRVGVRGLRRRLAPQGASAGPATGADEAHRIRRDAAE